MQKWGKHRNGKTRYRCSTCKKTGTQTRNDLVRKGRRHLYQKWLLSKLTLTDYGIKYGVSRRTLDRWFEPFREVEITADEVNLEEEVYIIDGYYLQYAATVLVAQTPSNQVVGWSFTYAENFRTWLEFFNSICSFPSAVVCDGQKGMFKAIKERWPGVIIQRCQFHVIHHINLLLTKHPETAAAQEFKLLVGGITEVKTEADFRLWLVNYKDWYRRYHIFFKQRTYQDYSTPTGRRKWHYTHSHLHAAHSHLKNAISYLFQYLKFPEIPNTSNRIEGGVNAQIQRYIDRHRGTKLLQRKQIIAALLRQKQLQKPTQNVT
jgi:putative transposase